MSRYARREKRLLVDEEVVNVTKDFLRKFAPDARSGKRHFFVAAGFYKPHMPPVCGEEFFDFYDPDEIDLAEYGYLPQGYPEASCYPSYEFFNRPDLAKYNYTDDVNVTLPDHVARPLRRAYFLGREGSRGQAAILDSACDQEIKRMHLALRLQLAVFLFLL